MPEVHSPAEAASLRALEAMYTCLAKGQSFRLEAGAGAGKTYSLIKALRFLIKHNNDVFQKHGKQIACITFTNVAKDEIAMRTDRGVHWFSAKPITRSVGLSSVVFRSRSGC